MKFVINERIKHRLVGLVVLLSVAAIFVPAIVKKSSTHIEENMSVSVKLPPKPTAPRIVMKDEKALFKTLKTAAVKPVIIAPTSRPIQLAKAEALSKKSLLPAAPAINKGTVLAKAAIVKAATTGASQFQDKGLAVKKEIYAVQVASFTQQSNAKLLVDKLRSKGYRATYNKSTGKQGDIYKVVVGELHEKNEALSLQKKLSVSMRLNGFVIKTGVS